MRNRLICLAAAVMLGLSMASSQAALITFNFTASSGSNTASGSFTFDTAVLGTGTATAQTYTDALPLSVFHPYSGSANVSGLGAFNFWANRGDIAIRDGDPSGSNFRDQFQARSGGGDGVGDNLAGWTVLAIVLSMDAFQSSDPPFINSVALPSVPPSIFGLSEFALVIGEDGTTSSIAYRMTLTSLTAAVPEPATLALLAFGLAGLGFSRRKH